MVTLLDASLSREVGGRTTMVGDLEISPNGFDNYL